MKRRLGFLWIAILLLAASIALMLRGEEPAPKRPELAVNLPRSMTMNEVKRFKERRTLPALPAPDAGESEVQAPAHPRDPVLAAISAPGRGSAVVVEANAIRNSPVGQLLLDCLRAESKEDPIERMKRESGVDLLQDLDRVAVTEDGVVFSGHFANARWADLFGEGATTERYGDSGALIRPSNRVGAADGGRARGRQEVVGTWGDQLLVVADSDAKVRALIDRVEGRAAIERPVVDESQTYGEIYGVLSAEDLSRIMAGEQEELAQRLRTLAERIEIHVDATGDVGVVADVHGSDSAQLEDLSKSLGGALAIARMQAQREGADPLVDLLDLAQVRPNGNRFRLEMAVPLELVKRHLAKCGERRRSRELRDAPTSASED